MDSERAVRVRWPNGNEVAVYVPKTRDWFGDHQAALDEVDRRTLAQAGRRIVRLTDQVVGCTRE